MNNYLLNQLVDISEFTRNLGKYDSQLHKVIVLDDFYIGNILEDQKLKNYQTLIITIGDRDYKIDKKWEDYVLVRNLENWEIVEIDLIDLLDENEITELSDKIDKVNKFLENNFLQSTQIKDE